MRKTGTIALVLAATIGASTAPPALVGGSSSPPVRCGQVISHDTRLSKDLVNCPGTALTIGADGVTLDLATTWWTASTRPVARASPWTGMGGDHQERNGP